METLPLEMVSKISRYLTPQDLARCCGVCHGWREMFNDDCHWRPHCDPALAEQLCNTVCVVEPAFVAPEDSKSTLTPIGHWRLAFMRENHLWENWKQGNHKEEKVSAIKNENRIDFLTNTLVARWCTDRIEIWDVSVTPMAFVSRTDPSVDLADFVNRSVVGSDMLLVEQIVWLKVFYVDALNKRVELKHNIPLEEERHEDWNLHFELLSLEKENIYVLVNSSRLSLEIIDLETGTKTNETCPVTGNGAQKAAILGIKSSPTSDNVIVAVETPWNSFHQQSQCYIYSQRQRTFLQGPVVQSSNVHVDRCAVHENYLAFADKCAVKIYNCHTLELTFQKTYNTGDFIRCPSVFNDSFIFTVTAENEVCYLWMFSLLDKKITTNCIELEISHLSRPSLESINNKILYLTNSWNISTDLVGVWEAAGRTLKRSDISIKHGYKINQAFTCGISLNSVIQYYW